METAAYPTDALLAALNRLRSSTDLAVAVRYLTAHAGDLNAELGKTVLAEIPAYRQSANPDILPEFAQHASAHNNEILRLLGGGLVADFEFVRTHAKRRAEQHFPLEAMLHAYRCGHKVFSHWLRNAILSASSSVKKAPAVIAAVADFTLEYTDAISTVATSSYVAQIRLLADVAIDNRIELLNILLGGYDESDGRVTEILRENGYLDARQSYCVMLAQSVDPAEMLNPARARRLAEAVGNILRASTVRRLVDVRGSKVVGIFSDTRRTSGWTAPHTALAKRISAESSMLGNAILVGISNDVPSTSRIPGAHREALLALGLTGVANRVIQFSEVPTQRLLLHLAGEDLKHALPAWTAALIAADENAGGALIATLRAYAQANMNVLKAAEVLSVHPNTIYSRMQRIQDITQLDARSFHGLGELLIIADCSAR
ncbi:MAG: PucR family transcriptional regulator [Burkholderiales bacterium]